HDANLSSEFPTCPNTPPTDPGSACGTYPAVGRELQTAATLLALRQHNTNLSFVTYNNASGTQIANCQAAMAQFADGNEVVHGVDTDSLKTQIVKLVNDAASHVDQVNFDVTMSSSPAEV